MAAFSTVLFYTVKQGIRRRFILAASLFCAFVILLSLALGGLSLGESKRISTNFGLAAVEISIAVLSALFGALLTASDLERKALMTFFLRPISPALFFAGRFAGLALLSLGAIGALSLILTGFFLIREISVSWSFLAALTGFYLKSLFMLALSLLFASYASPFFALLSAGAAFIIGHSMDAFNYIFKKSAFIKEALVFVIPDLNRVNWKSAVVYGDSVPIKEFAGGGAYVLCWSLCILALALYIFENREYG